MKYLEQLTEICIGLGINESSNAFERLSEFYEKTKRFPSASEIAFIYAALLKDEYAAKSKPLLSEAECCNEDFRELLSEFIKRYNRSAGSKSDPPISALAEYAATGKVTRNKCGIFVDLSDDREFPDVYSGSSETVCAGELTITLSTGKPMGGRLIGDVCAMLSPANGQNIEDFINKATLICRTFLKKNPDVVIKPVSSEGLISDLAFMGDGYVIDTSLFPVPGESPSSVFAIEKPAVLIFSGREHLHELWEIASAYDITPTAPIANRAKYVNVRSGEVNLVFNKSDLEIFGSNTGVRMRSSELLTLDEPEVILCDRKLALAEESLTVLKLGGDHVYEALEEATADRSAAYAICGVLSTDDEASLPLIITLDAFRRNCQPNVIYSRFFVKGRTSIYVFKLSKKK